MRDIPLIPYTKKRLSDHVADSLNEYIEETLRRGTTKLPSEVDLASALNISRTTVRRALTDLENKGVVQRIHGKGTFINPNIKQMKVSLSSGFPLFETIRLSGYKPSVKLLYTATEEASLLQQSALSLDESDVIVTICRVYSADGHPVILLIDYVPEKYIGTDYDETDLTNSTYKLILMHSNIICSRDEVTISSSDDRALYADTQGKHILECNSALTLESVNYNASNKPVFLCKQYYDTSYIKFHMIRALDVY